MTFPVGVELQINGTWTDVSQRARMVPPTIHRGRPDELSQVAPTTATVVFDNTDGYLTPRNPNSPWYPHIGRGLPCRLSVNAGPRYLLLSGATGGRATTPDNAALDITGDLFMAVEFDAPVATQTTTIGNRYQVIAKWNSGTNNRSYYLGVTDVEELILFWSTDGTAATFAISELQIPQRTAGPIAVGVHLDVNNGAGGYTAKFWAYHGTITELVAALAVDETALRLGDPIIGGAPTSIFSSNAALEIGDITGTGDDPYPGGIRRAQVRSGDWTGTIVANPDFTTQTVGATTFTDSASRAWTVQTDAQITDRQTRFLGTTDAITLNWPKATQRDSSDAGVAAATFTCSGRLRAMQQGQKPLQSTLRRLLGSPSLASVVHGYWPLEDGRDATRASTPIQGAGPGRMIGLTPASDDTLDASAPLPNAAGGLDRYGWDMKIPPTGSTTSWTVTFFVNIATAETTPAFTRLMQIYCENATAASWRLSLNNTTVAVQAFDSDGTEIEFVTVAADASMFGGWLIVALNVTQNGADIDWDIDLIPISTGVNFGTNATITSFTCGRVRRLQNLVGGSLTPVPPDGISVGHFIVSDFQSAGWLAGADTAWIGESAAHRVYRLCNEEQIPVVIHGDNTLADSFRGDPAFSEPMGPQLQATLLELLQECAAADLGILYEQRNADGLAFRTRRSLYNQSAAMTFDLKQDGLIGPFEPVLDDQRLRNDITVVCRDESSARIVDDDSVTTEGLYDEEFTLNLAGGDTQCHNQAGWRLHLGTWPELRFPTTNTSMLTAGIPVLHDWIDTDLGDRVTASNLMRQYDRTAVQLVEGYDETLSLFDWQVGFVGSPEGPWEVGVRNSATLGKRDTAGSELASAVTTTATSLSVATTLGPVWSAVDADDGFDINVGGEQMTVTDISGTTSPQTFTVVRSVNGVIKAHASATDVRLWRATVRAL